MKKTFIAVIALTIMGIISAQAQEPTFNKGDKVINASIGLGSVLYSGIGYSTQIPPISASMEIGVKDDFLTKNLNVGLGGYLGFSKYKWDYSSYYYGYNWGYTYSNLIIGGRATAHYPFLDKLDTYGGIMIGFDIVTDKEYGTSTGVTVDSHGSGLVWSSFLGARYYFKDNFAVMGEIGYGIAWLNLGLSYKF